MKLLATTILLLSVFTASADSDYQPESNSAPIYPPSLENGFLSLSVDRSENHALVYAPSIIWIESVKDKGAGNTYATLHMIEGNTIKTVVSFDVVRGLLNAKTDKIND